MDGSNLKEEISSVNWSEFNGPLYFDSKIVPSVLIELMGLDGSVSAENVGSKVVDAIGNNHAGTYYPVVLKALDYIIRIEKNTRNQACRICAMAILNDLYYFEPELEGFSGCSDDELRNFVKDKLEPYSDENFKIADV